ncbi:hypothetical protein [Thioalkalivibrio sp. XN279]|uniref:hypothetical protein n=1 Tax=Thioalkalivibrio sp. XN279 TaxID=2714953 RepID=UPI0014096F35|nr:hypothetical protein [Thioalkalivibrio sp. XN279]NHA14602.1 hypothetical protein [Thioalkalivibrio sp. XN279]
MRTDSSMLGEYCTDLYQRTYTLWRGLEGRYATWECRYSILYGPPVANPELMIIGSNPGFNTSDLYDAEVLTWPRKNEYLAKHWPLAVRLRSLFESAGAPGALAQSVGTNRLFFKSKSLGRHPTGLGWQDNPASIRRDLEAYCSAECEKLMAVLQPRRVLALGLGVFDQVVGVSESQITGTGGRRIAASGFACGIPVLGIIHPTGARVSNVEWQRVAEWLGAAFGRQPERPEVPDETPVDTDSEIPAVAQGLGAGGGGRQPPLRPDTVIRAARKPSSSYKYQPIHDFWHELARMGEISVADFHDHMGSTGWRRPQGKPLTYEVTRTDIASMCREGFAVRVRG